MKKFIENGEAVLKKEDLISINGGHPVLVVLGVITTGIALGKAMDQAGQWFLDGWNNPR